MSNQIHPHVLASVRLTAMQLTTQELAAIYNVATAKFDPRGIQCYEKAKSLFTEFDGTRMHADTLAALEIVVQERLEQEKQTQENNAV